MIFKNKIKEIEEEIEDNILAYDRTRYNELKSNLKLLKDLQKQVQEKIEELDYYELYSEMIEEMGDEELDQHWVMVFVDKINCLEITKEDLEGMD